MADLFDLQAKISLDSSEYEKGLQNSEKKTETYRGAVMKLAQEYKNSGMTMSEAMKQAYSEIDKSQYETEKVSQQTAANVEKNWSEADVSNELEDGFDDVDKSQKETEKTSEKTSNDTASHWSNAGEKIGSALKKAFEVGMAAIGAATTAVIGFAKSSLSVGAEFDSSMSQVAATLGMTMEEIQNNVDGAGDTFNALRDKADEMGRSTNFSASQAAEGLNILAMSGFSAGESIDMVEDVLHLAAAGSMDMASAAGYISGAMKGFADDTKDAQYYADLMAKGATLASTSVAELGDAMSSGAAGAAAYGQSADSMTIALLRLAEQGDTGAAAGTALSAAMKDLYTPTDQGAKALKELGVAAYNMDGSARDVNEVINELSGALSGMSAEEANAYKQTIFGIQGLNAYNKMAVTGIDTQERWANALAEASEGAGEAAKQYNTMTDNLQGDVDSWNSAMDGFKIAISDQLMPTVREFVQFGTSGMSQLTDAFKSGGLSGAMEALGGVLSDGLNMVIEMLPDVVEAGSQLLGALIDGIITNLPTIAEAALQIITQLGTSLVNNIPSIMSNLTTVIMQIVSMLTDPGTLSSLLNVGLDLILALADGLMQAIPDLISKLPEIITNIVEFLLGAIPDIIQAGIDLLTSLVEDLPTIISAIVTAIPELISSLITGIIEHIPDIIQAGIELITSLVEDLPTIITSIVNAIPEIISSLIEALLGNIDKLIEAGITLLIAIVKDTPAIIAGVVKAIPTIIASIVNALDDAVIQIVEAGVNLVKGLWDGIASAASWLWDKVSGWLGGLVGGIKNFLGIASPSKVFAEIGENMGEGIGVGFEDAMEDVSKDMLRTLNATVDDLKDSGIDWEQYGELAWMSNGGIEGLYDEMRYNFEEIQTSAEDLADYLHSEYELSMSDANKAVETLYNKTAENVANLLEEEERISTTTRSSTRTSGNGYRGLFGVDNAGGTVTNTVTINVYPSEGMDENEIADLVERKLMTALDRREAAWA